MTPEQREVLVNFIDNLVRAAAAAALYPFEHRQVARHASKAFEEIDELTRSTGMLTLTLIEDQLFTDGQPLTRSPFLDRFTKALKLVRIGNIIIGSGVTRAELNLLIRVAAGMTADVGSTAHLSFGSVSLPENEVIHVDRDLPIPSYADIPEELMKGLVATFEDCRARKKLDLTSILQVAKGFAIAFRREADPFLALVPLREMDEYTFTHSIDVCILNLAQGMALGFEGQLLHDIGVAAMLHDVGKMFVPKDILNKAGALEEWEWEAIRQHTVKGAEYLLNTPGVPRLAVLSAFEHHLNYDLTGYPDVPATWQINLCSQMTMVSDFFDALRTRRVYRDAMDFEKVAGLMLDMAGTKLNPNLTLNFLAMLRKMGEH